MEILLMGLLASGVVYGEEGEKVDRSAISIGFLNGGGSLLGVDYERLVTESIGVGVGAGLVGFGGGVNFHLYPSIDGPSIRIGYANQGGTGNKLSMRSVHATYLSRNASGILEWQFGIAVPLVIGPASPLRGIDVPPIILWYGIGAYFSM